MNMNEKSAQPVDVLGRLASMAVRYDEWEAIHDAVAELIEAAKLALHSSNKPIRVQAERALISSGLDVTVVREELRQRDRAALATLARVQGGAA